MKNLTCIVCPIGCALSVDDKDLSDIKVSGNGCPRGKNYAIQEVTCPQRVVTTLVKVVGGNLEVVSVKTNKAIDKAKVFDVLTAVKGIVVDAPTQIGQVIISNVAGTGADIVATKNIVATAK
ncbi:MAG: DUF1667 domain-containing protein [Clostridia bacterium]